MELTDSDHQIVMEGIIQFLGMCTEEQRKANMEVGRLIMNSRQINPMDIPMVRYMLQEVFKRYKEQWKACDELACSGDLRLHYTEKLNGLNEVMQKI